MMAIKGIRAVITLIKSSARQAISIAIVNSATEVKVLRFAVFPTLHADIAVLKIGRLIVHAVLIISGRPMSSQSSARGT